MHSYGAAFRATQKLYYTRDVFYVRRVVDLMKTAKLNGYIMHMFGKIDLYLYIQPKIISKCITLMTSKRQRHTYTENNKVMSA